MRIDKLLADIEARYKIKTRKSRTLFHRAGKVMVRGGSHNLRLWHPYPFFVDRAEGAYVYDGDGNLYIDFWQGHYANILGHNPPLIRRGIEKKASASLHTGFEGEEQIELAELLLNQLGYKRHKLRFTTSGTLAAMYAIMLAKAFTKRALVLKIGGGWHGASPHLLKGVKFRKIEGYKAADSAGLGNCVLDEVLITKFNDGQDLARVLRKHGSRIACLIMEPFLGVGGFLPSSREYLELARQLTRKFGILLVFDEVISGFRFCPSAVQTLYGVQPDLTTFGKLIGGGHAVAAVVGRNEIMDACGGENANASRVFFEGGTFSGHAEYMRAGLLMLRHLRDHGEKVYPMIGDAGETLRKGIEKAFRERGIAAVCTGGPAAAVKQSSLFMVHFPLKEGPYEKPEDVWDPSRSDVRLREEALKLALAVRGVHVVHGGGAVSSAHTKRDIDRTIEAYADAADLFRRYR
jgi:glutamate-1-semialdehyde 2,1-aminomutase